MARRELDDLITLAREERIDIRDIASIRIRVSAAALNYPGCNATGPFQRVLQAKMSIQYCAAAALLRGTIEEANYGLLKDPELMRLIAATKDSHALRCAFNTFLPSGVNL